MSGHSVSTVGSASLLALLILAAFNFVRVARRNRTPRVLWAFLTGRMKSLR